MTTSEIKAALAAQLRMLALWRGQKGAGRAPDARSRESMEALLALADAVAAVSNTHPALLKLVFLPSAGSDTLPSDIPNSVLLGAYGFAAMQGGSADAFLKWIARTRCA